MLFFSLCFQKR